MARHWTERMTCICGWSTFSVTKEAYHRHNFPALCRRARKNEGSKVPSVTTRSRTEGDLTMTQKDRDDARDLELEALLDRAHAAAKAAADEAEASATTWFPCGFAWVTIVGTTPLARHCREASGADVDDRLRYGDRGYPSGWQWWCPGHQSTQRMETHEAAARAFAAVLAEAGIPATVGSRMD